MSGVVRFLGRKHRNKVIKGRSKLLINGYRALVLEDKCLLMIGSQQYKYTSYYTFENKLIMCVSYGN